MYVGGVGNEKRIFARGEEGGKGVFLEVIEKQGVTKISPTQNIYKDLSAIGRVCEVPAGWKKGVFPQTGLEVMQYRQL